MEEKKKNSLKQAALRRWFNYVIGYTVTYRGNFREKSKGKMKSKEYIETLRQCTIQIIVQIMGDNFLLQQDSCSVHALSKTLEFLERAALTKPKSGSKLDRKRLGNNQLPSV